jgi:hypothetical protein
MSRWRLDDRSRSRTRTPPRTTIGFSGWHPAPPSGQCERCGTGLDHRVQRLTGRWLAPMSGGDPLQVCRPCFMIGDLQNMFSRFSQGQTRASRDALDAFNSDLEILWSTTRNNIALNRADRAFACVQTPGHPTVPP